MGLFETLRLRFADPAEERSFIQAYDGRYWRVIAVCSFFAVVVHFVFGVLDYLAHPAVYGQLWTWRIVLAGPTLAATVLFALHPRLRWGAQAATAAAIFASGLAVVLMLGTIADQAGARVGGEVADLDVSYASGLLLVLFFAYAFTRLRVAYAAVASLAFTVAFELIVLTRFDWLDPRVLEQQFFLLSGHVIGISACWTLETAARRDFHVQRQLAAAKKESDDLLRNVLPESIADRLKSGESLIADRVDNVSVLFIDLVGFTPMAERKDPQELVELLSGFFVEIDRLTARHGAEKIKTIGDAYMIVGGAPLPEDGDAHVRALADLSLDVVALFVDGPPAEGLPDGVRLGLHCGPVVAGVIGEKRLAYDLWGSTVNLASRLESRGEPGRIHISQQVRDALGDDYVCELRRGTEIKGVGTIDTWFLLGRSEARGG